MLNDKHMQNEPLKTSLKLYFIFLTRQYPSKLVHETDLCYVIYFLYIFRSTRRSSPP